MRRRSNQPTVSLFSFQDIITSVTAILILVVLILTLELITRKFEAEAGDPAASKRSIVDAVTELESIVTGLASVVPPESSNTAVSLSLAVPDSELRTLRDQMERASSRVEDARRVDSIAKKFADEARTALAQEQSQSGSVEAADREADQLAKQAKDLVAKNAAEQARLEARRQEVEGRPMPGPELVFRRPRGNARRSWLLEVTDRGFAVLELGTGRTTPLGSSFDDQSELARWIGSLLPDTDYVLILVRPSGIGTEIRARERLLADKVSHGIDFIGEEQAVRDGSVDDGSLADGVDSGELE
jgi:hypothetical protein